MSDATLPLPARAGILPGTAGGPSIAAIAWRNLWRNRRRTWLTSGGIGFAGFLVIAINSLQTGTFETMIDRMARFFSGHVQIQHPQYLADPRTEYTVANAAARLEALDSRPDVDGAAPRAQAFALLSGVPAQDAPAARAVGGLVVGVDPAREFAAIRYAPASGRYLAGPGEAFLGAVLAKNLGVAVGDEVAIVGNSEAGGVAALAATVVGTFSTGQAEADRSWMHVPLAEFQEAFGLGDRVHAIAVTLKDAAAAEAAALALTDSETAGVPWQRLLPDVHQLAELKYQGTYMIYALLLVLVTFSIVNAFLMTTFERTPEFGMMKALGMGPVGIVRMMAWEALWLALLGLALALLVSVPLVLVLSATGISFGAAYAEITAQYLLPDRLYPTLAWRAALEFAVAVLVLTQIAAAIPALRLRRLRVVDALRHEE